MNIYVLTQPVGTEFSEYFRYIGMTKSSLKSRLCDHMANAKRGRKLPVYDWLREVLSHGDKPGIELLEVTEDTSREAYWIHIYRTWGFNLTNMVDTVGHRALPGKTPL